MHSYSFILSTVPPAKRSVKYLQKCAIVKKTEGAVRMQTNDYISQELLDKFEFYNYNHALEILTQAFSEEWGEVTEMDII